MAITPDIADWTWVLERPCPDCGFRAADVEFDDLPRLIRANAAAWVPVLSRADAAVRPNDHTRSPLEYTAHVRDVCLLFAERLQRLLDEEDPLLANWDQDATAIAERYDLQAPEKVGRELKAAAASVADAFAAVPEDARQRTARRSDGASFTAETFGAYFLHDIVHHLHDVAGD
ncbi:methyltransferase type 12 [Cryobacterium roopkundense]|uniref:Methyltransferase type 12 n=1 Tax=Cryobacterium roopkundense TaxID=1001240 RepID=A0A099J454_9MICO|nr:DinB family protein [Cryobacterium roopkundense]KGJ72865.1 methyltransferase type 12 [Cryobacterium roopkundense]MBB5643144.1 hypothetical protein [Cryobacterium roopkundense]